MSAQHGNGTGDLLDEVVNELRKVEVIPEEEVEAINVAIIGRPNAGKSSLTNKLTNNNRSIVSDVAGTTRDAIDTLVEHEGQMYRIVDTAGLRRKSQIDEDVEYYGFVRAMRAIDRADVALLVIDGTLGLTNEDQRVAGYAAERGCAMVIVLNKWDIVEGPEEKAKIRERIEDRMTFVGYAPVVAISALTGKRVDRIWNAIDDVYANYSRTIPTARLNTWLAGIRETGHTVSKGKAVLRMKYLTQTGACPPHFTFFVNRPDVVDDNYERYLENRMREAFPAGGHAHPPQVQEEGLGHGTVVGWLTLSFAVSFLLGSIPWGVIVSKLAFHKDIRDEDRATSAPPTPSAPWGRSGRARVRARFREGACCRGLPFGSGPRWRRCRWTSLPTASAALGGDGNPALNPVGLALALAFAGCTLGHIFSPWLKFKGGKGIAVALPACGSCSARWVFFHRDRRVRPRHRRHPLRVCGLHRRRGHLPAARPVLLLGPVGTLAHHRRHGLRRHLGPPRQHRPPARGHGEQDRW